MPLDPTLAALIEQRPPFDPALTAMQVRSRYAELQALLGVGNQQVTSVDRTIPGAVGEIPVRIYTPPTGSPPWGLVVFYHGGGFVIGGLDTHDAICRDLTAGTDTTIVSIDYRLAPEDPFPAAVDDAWAALQWAYKNAGEFDADPGRLAVAGDSSGGNLAAVVALMARDYGLGLRLQLLVYPGTDFSRRRPSIHENGRDYLVTQTHLEWFEGHYAPDRTDWRASPMLAPDHRGVAAAAVLTCEFDPLRDEGNDYASTLAAAGVPVTTRCYSGLIHGAFAMTSVIPSTRPMMDDACMAVRNALVAG